MLIKKIALKICLSFVFITIMSFPLFSQIFYQNPGTNGIRLGRPSVDLAYKKYVSLTQNLPFLPWKKTERAKEIKEAATAVFNKSLFVSTEYENLLRYHINNLGKQRMNLLNTTVNDFISSLKQLERKHKEKFYEIEKEANISSDNRQQFDDMGRFINKLQLAEIKESEITSAAFMLATTGVAATAAAVGTPTAVSFVVSSLATAGTGAPISTLSGAAATNATLAWLGGGSVASGGGGVAAGATVMTGITVAATGIVLVVAGTAYHWYAENKLKETIKNGDEVVKAAKDMEKSWDILGQNIKNMENLESTTEKLAPIAKTSLNKLRRIVNVFDCENEEHVKIFQQTAASMKDLIDVINISAFKKKTVLKRH